MATTKTLTPTNQTITIQAFQGEKPDFQYISDAEGKIADAVNALNSQITTYQNGTYYFANSHSTFAGRNGWSGLVIRFSVPTGREKKSNNQTATFNLGGTTVYACTKDGVTNITSNISSIDIAYAGKGIFSSLEIILNLSSNPLSFNEGIVNVSFAGGTPTIVFANG